MAGSQTLAEFRASVVAATPFQAIHDINPVSDLPCIYSTDPAKKPLSFKDLHAFIDNMALVRFGIGRTDTVCTSIPNGPEAAMCFYAIASQCTHAPLNPGLLEPELAFELQDLPAKAMIVMDGDPKAELVARCCGQHGVLLLVMRLDLRTVGLFTLHGPSVGTAAAPTALPTASPTALSTAGPEDVALVLHTSGTTKKPKIVPLTHFNLGSGIQYVATTLCRQKHHVNLNVMPLFHIHGLIANVGDMPMPMPMPMQMQMQMDVCMQMQMQMHMHNVYMCIYGGALPHPRADRQRGWTFRVGVRG